MKRIILIILLFSLLNLGGLWAVDFGVVLQGEFTVAGQDETDISGSIILAPWVSVPFQKSELHISAGLNTSISDDTYFAPELFRLEFSAWPIPILSFRVGRFTWEDPSGLLAKGRFDGADILIELGKLRFGVNALYTGFLFNDTAHINASPTDPVDYNAGFEWAEFVDTYFAPRRLMTSLYGEFPGFPLGRGQLYAGLTAQFDLSDASEAFNTQYLLLRHTLFYKAFDLEVAGAVELENTKADGLRPAFAASLDAGLQLPTAFKDRISLGAAWASGEGPATAAFFPIVLEAQGTVLIPSLSGMMIIRANYEARFLPFLSMELGGRYFIRTDSTSFIVPYLEDDSYLLGAEIDAGITWVPFSDLAFTLKGGIFLPKTGTAWADDAPVMWKVTLGAGLSF